MGDLPNTKVNPDATIWNNTKPSTGKTRGRPVDESFHHFHRGERKSHGHYEGKCIYCHKHFPRAKAGNFREHLAVCCTKVPKHVRQRFHRLLTQPIVPTENISMNDGTGNSSNKRKQSGKKLDYCASSSKKIGSKVFEEHQQQDMFLNKEYATGCLIRALVTGDIPFYFTENIYFKEFCQSISAYQLPSCQYIEEKELFEEANRISLSIDVMIAQADSITLAISNLPRTNNIFIWSVILPNKISLIYRVKQEVMESSTETFLYEETRKIIDIFSPEKFIAIVNNTTKKSDDILSHLHMTHPHIIFVNSASYYLDLLTQDLVQTPFLQEVINHTQSLVNFVKQSSSWEYRFEEIKKELKIANYFLTIGRRGSWNLIYSMCSSVLKYRIVFSALSNQLGFPTYLSQVIEQDRFWCDLEIATKILSPIEEISQIIVAEIAPTIADSHVCFMTLAKYLNSLELERNGREYRYMINCFNNRWKEYTQGCSAVFKLCFYLHPGYRGEGLKESCFRNIMATAGSLWKSMGNSALSCLALMTQLKTYDMKNPPYDNDFDWKKYNPFTWWLQVTDPTGNQLKSLALHVHSIRTDLGSIIQQFLKLNYLQVNRNQSNIHTERIGAVARIYTWCSAYLRESISNCPSDLYNNRLQEILKCSLEEESKAELEVDSPLIVKVPYTFDQFNDENLIQEIAAASEYNLDNNVFDITFKANIRQSTRDLHLIAINYGKGGNIEQQDYDVMSIVETILVEDEENT